MTKSMKAKGKKLADTMIQLNVLNGKTLIDRKFPSFTKQVKETTGLFPLQPTGIDIFQINMGKMCNQVCHHCHVDAGPDRKEIMTRETLERCLEILTATDIKTVDLTGGAPEMNPHFFWFVEELSKLGKHIIVRCNLTIILANKKYHRLPQFYKDNKVEVVSSLPYFSERRTDSQRGNGVFEQSIRALKMLNEVGYGMEGTPQKLNLVYNPSGAFLPTGQAELEAEFKRQLKRKFNIHFNNLFAITNIPISRFLEYLLESGNYENYMEKLVEAYNPTAVENVMCRNTISVSWDGFLYDCDFNQMLELKVASLSTQHINDFDIDVLKNRHIVLNQHCYGCTAGAGSSCGGEVA